MNKSLSAGWHEVYGDSLQFSRKGALGANAKAHMVALTLCLLGTLIIPVSKASVTIATWNFDSGTDNSSAYTGSVPYNANTYVHSDLQATPNVNAVTPVSGATQGPGTGNPGTGVDLQFTSPGGNGAHNPDTSTFTLTLKAASGVTLSGFSITYDALSSNSSGTAAVNKWTWAITGGGSDATGIQTSIAQDNTWHTVTATFSGTGHAITLNAGQTITFTDTLSGYAGQSGTVGFDNINVNVNAVPEPANVAMALFGTAFAVIGIGRRYLGNRGVSRQVAY